MKIVFLILIFIITFFNSAQLKCAEINFKKANYENKTFLIQISGTIKAKPAQDFSILTNYEQISRISPKIIESLVINHINDNDIVKTTLKNFVLFFCKTIVNTQEIKISESRIFAKTIGKDSDLKFGEMEWQINETAKEGYTQIIYNAKIEPNFFVPPIIGICFIKQTLSKEAETLLVNIENISNQEMKKQN